MRHSLARQETCNARLKDRVREFWNRHVCCSSYAQTDDGVGLDFQKLAETRYRLEPYIHELANFPSGRDRRVLEIGVGAGTDFSNWIAHGARAAGIDLTPAAVEFTRQHLDARGVPRDAYTLMVGDAEDLRFDEGSFDIVYSYGVLHTTPDTERAFREVYRVLDHGGIFRGMVYHVPSVAGSLFWLRYGLLGGRPFMTPRQAIYEHLESPGTKAYTVREMREMLERTGFTGLELWTKLGLGDLLLQRRSAKYAARCYALVWKWYPRRWVRLLGDRFGTPLMIVARKV